MKHYIHYRPQKYKKKMEYAKSKANNFDICIKNSNFARKI